MYNILQSLRDIFPKKEGGVIPFRQSAVSEAFPPIPGMRLSSIDLMVPDPPERRTVRMLPYDKSSEIAASLILDEGEQDYACIPSVN